MQADCVIIPKSGTYDIVTTSQGTVRDVLVQRGDQLAAGEPVAVVETIDGARTEVLAPVGGEVIELLATFGDFVEVGTALVNFDQDEEDLAVLLYVSPSVSGELESGMEAHISPDTAAPRAVRVPRGSGRGDRSLPVDACRDEGPAEQRHPGR